MLNVIKKWFQRYLSDPEAVLLLIILLLSFTVIMTFGRILAPLLVSLVIAYLLETWITLLEGFGVRRLLALYIVFLSSLSLFFLGIFILLPLTWHQLYHFFNDIPALTIVLKNSLQTLSSHFPELLSPDQMKALTQTLIQDIHAWGRAVLATSLSWIPGVFAFVIYCILVPMMIFFLLKDRQKILAWGLNYLPHKRAVLAEIWEDMNQQLGNYIRGKITQILIVSAGSYLFFVIMGLEYSLLLAICLGLSVVIPYVGATLVMIPVVIVAYVQWGLGSSFWYLIAGYLLIQALDGHILVPLLFSEAVNLHPLAIIISILFFGGLWGIWGLFFAIPLATLVQSLVHAWPRTQIMN